MKNKQDICFYPRTKQIVNLSEAKKKKSSNFIIDACDGDKFYVKFEYSNKNTYLVIQG